MFIKYIIYIHGDTSVCDTADDRLFYILSSYIWNTSEREVTFKTVYIFYRL